MVLLSTQMWAAKEPLGVKLDSLGPRSCGFLLANRHVCVRPLGAPGLVAEAPRQPSLRTVPAVCGASSLPVLQEQPPHSPHCSRVVFLKASVHYALTQGYWGIGYTVT